MANWNLSVDLRGHGNDLAQSLKSAAKHARTLGTAARTAKVEVRELGQASQTATRHIRTLGTAARTTARRLNTLGNDARTAGRQLGRYGDAARTANRHVNSLGDNSRTTGRQLARMSGQIDTAVRDLLRLAQAAQRASTHMRTVGAGGARGLRQMTNESGRLRHQLTGLAALLSGGALVMGVGDLIKHGNEYQQSMNTFGAVTGATAMQMQRASATANQLGNDLSLPGATAAEAADAMVELAKAGFRTDQAISATRASLTLASAAQVNAADSAKYLGDMMDQFGMGADQAGKAADTLAATANAASGDITDIYYAMKYAGPVAHGLGVNMQEAAAAVGMLGKAGILGQTAGTTLRGMMANLASPTKQMTQGLEDMGIQAWDAQGNFKGLRYVIDGLSKAQHKMTQQDFAAAVKKSMGKPAMSGAIALAHQGVDSFDALMAAVTDAGAATDIAAAKGKGLAGAMLQLKTQARQTGLALYDGMAPGLEFLTRGITSGLSKATPHITKFFNYVNDAATLFGPDVAAAARQQFASIGAAAQGMLTPFKELGGDAVASALHVLLSVGQMVVDVLKNLAAGVAPVVSALGDLAGEGSGAASTLDIVVFALDAAASAVSALSGVLGPIGRMVGSLVSAFGALPGPVQTAVFAMLLMRRVGPMAQSLAGTVGGRLTGAFQSLNRQMLVQQSQARRAGQSLTQYGAAFRVLQARVPVIGAMGNSFRTASAGATGFGGALRGVTAAAGTGLRSAMGGLMGVMGGPWGVALTGVTVGLGLLASSQQKAAAEAAEHKATIDGLTSAMRQSNGVIDESVRQQAAQSIQSTKLKGTNTDLVSVMGKMGYTLSDLTDSYLGQGESIDSLAQKMKGLTKEKIKAWEGMGHGDKDRDAVMQQANAYAAASLALESMSGDAKSAAKNAKELNAATKGTGDGVTAYDRLKNAVHALADKTADADSRTRALREALDLLSGGSVSFQAAETRLHEAITNANDAIGDGVVKADGWGKQLLKANGTIDATTKNGQRLSNSFSSIADGAASAAVAAFDFAQSQGKDLPTSLKAATDEIQMSRDAVIGLGKRYGWTKKQAEGVADSMGLIPGRVSILLQTEGVDTVLAELLGVQAEFQRFPDKKTIKVDALGADAKKELQDIGYQIELIPGTREYKITAPTQAARAELDLLITKLGQTNGKTLDIKAPSAKAKAELQTIQDKVRDTKGKTLSIKAPTTEARQHLEALGFKIKNTKGKTVTITVPTGDATRNAAIIQSAIDNIHGKSVSIYLNYKKTGYDKDANGVPDMVQAPQARGSVLSFYANGGTNRRGIRENHTAQIAPAGAWRVWAEEETGGEAYIPLATSKRGRSRAITEETIRRLGGDPKSVQWHADGAVVAFDSGGFSYTPTGMRRDTSYVQSAYSDSHQPIDKDAYLKKVRAQKNAVDNLKAAEARLRQVRRGRHTHAQLVAAETRVSKARRAVATATDAARKAEARYKKQFSLSDWQKTLKSAVSANASYEKNLAKIASRGGSDVIDQLRDLGEEGAALVAALAKASKKQFNDIVANLRKLGPLAKASLADYTKQLNASNKTSSTFQTNLAKLASMGYGDLATQLAGQGDEAAQKIAAEAVKNKGKASSANAAAKTSAKTLSGDELAQLLQIIAAVKTSKTGLHAVADTTGIGEDEIITVANKASAQIKSSLGSRSAQFLADLARANKGLSYANGGIREGIYATRAGAVTFAEPSTGGEAYIPLGVNKRRAATNVLKDVAARFGVGLTDMSATRPVVIVREGGDTHVNVTAVRTGASASDIGSQVGRSVRRARRGGVNARAAA
ncbi:phage tail tape measure protein [Streptomyces sp. NPDC047515]|uniref:phage tail tape measure protein n=1 Tax=Streptomyces sp. NPDC047515 TaxID=3155380 RepID=UPI0033FCC7C2